MTRFESALQSTSRLEFTPPCTQIKGLVVDATVAHPGARPPAGAGSHSPLQRSFRMILFFTRKQRFFPIETRVYIMKKIALLRERFSHRRSTSTQSRSSRVRNGLCQRCRDLQLDDYDEESGKNRHGVVAKVQKPGLLRDCNLCQQFLAIFNTLAAADTRLASIPDFTISSSPLDVAGEQRDGIGDINLNLYFGDPPQVLRLFPAQGTSQSLHNHEDGLIRAVGNFVDSNTPNFEFVKSAIDACRESHGSTCASSLPHTHSLRLIDCKTRRLITVGKDHPYICLSYVWGPGTIEDEIYGSILPPNVPKTVEDALAVAINLEIPFLWVDRYCINQENPDEKHDVIRNMDRIYQGAELTIIAALGDNPSHGLPGVRGTPRKGQCRLRVGKRMFVAAEEVGEEIRLSKWNSRAW